MCLWHTQLASLSSREWRLRRGRPRPQAHAAVTARSERARSALAIRLFPSARLVRAHSATSTWARTSRRARMWQSSLYVRRVWHARVPCSHECAHGSASRGKPRSAAQLPKQLGNDQTACNTRPFALACVCSCLSATACVRASGRERRGGRDENWGMVAHALSCAAPARPLACMRLLRTPTKWKLKSVSALGQCRPLWERAPLSGGRRAQIAWRAVPGTRGAAALVPSAEQSAFASFYLKRVRFACLIGFCALARLHA